MAEISPAALFGKLAEIPYKTIESAAEYCQRRGNPYVELAHWLHQILQQVNSDLHCTIQHFELDPAQLTNEEKTLTGSLYGSEDPATALPRLLEHVRAGRVDLASALGPSFPLEECEAAVRASLAGEPGRVLVRMEAA